MYVPCVQVFIWCGDILAVSGGGDTGADGPAVRCGGVPTQETPVRPDVPLPLWGSVPAHVRTHIHMTCAANTVSVCIGFEKCVVSNVSLSFVINRLSPIHTYR